MEKMQCSPVHAPTASWASVQHVRSRADGLPQPGTAASPTPCPKTSDQRGYKEISAGSRRRRSLEEAGEGSGLAPKNMGRALEAAAMHPGLFGVWSLSLTCTKDLVCCPHFCGATGDPKNPQWRGQCAKGGICLIRQHELQPTSGPLHMLFPLPGALHPFCLANSYPIFSRSLHFLP